MADQRVDGAGAPGRGPGAGQERGGLAWVVTEVAAPQYVAIALPPVTGLLAHGWTGAAWGLPAAATLAVGVALVGVIGWARVRVSHHTPTQTVAGAAAGAGVAWAVLTLGRRRSDSLWWRRPSYGH
jgi:membrane-associated phospholipid phosphatase